MNNGTNSRQQLGEILLARGIITQAQLSHCLSSQKNSGSRLGDIIIAEGFSNYFQLYSALAEHHALPFVDLLEKPPDSNLLQAADAEEYLKNLAMPYTNDGKNLIIATSEYSAETIDLISNRYGENYKIVIASPFAIRKTVEKLFGEFLENKSRYSLWYARPEVSALKTFSKKTVQYFFSALFAIFFFCIYYPLQTIFFFMAFCSFIYLLTMLSKIIFFASGAGAKKQIDWLEKLKNISDAELPTYTVLIPMYKEVASLPNMLLAMARMDYPPEKMDVKILLEADDAETYAAARALKPSYKFEILIVPPSELKTKPKACNYGLRFAKGKYIVVFDADDQPDPLELKKAVYAFQNYGQEVVCMQARLNYYNANHNLLTRLFSIEYSILFDATMQGLQRLKIPLPLGGTSNHIALAHLHYLGEWDPFNVTEDADLGVRIAALGMRTKMLDSVTMEEAPNRAGAWICQRSRWIKGYMQTWLVHMRSPKELYKTLGIRGFIGFQFFVGLSSFAFLTVPIIFIISATYWFLPDKDTWLVNFAMFNLLLYLASNWAMAFYSVASHGKPTAKNLVAAFLYPLYFILHSLASYMALWQLIVKPHYWEKTTHHGLASANASINP